MKLSDRFADAFACAFDWHRNQCRKGNDTPYMAHLMAVAGLVLEAGGAEDEAIAALLHDAIEDQGGSELALKIEEKFGAGVLSIIRECSDWDGDGEKPAWRQRKQSFIGRIGDMSPSGRLVATADKLHNARDILEDYRVCGEALWERFNGGRDGTLWYYRAVTDALEATGTSNRMMSELQRVVAELERAAALGSKR